MEVVIGIVCLLVGIVVGRLHMKLCNIGTLRVDRSDPTEPPLLFLEELTCYPTKDMKYVTLKVRIENFISQD